MRVDEMNVKDLERVNSIFQVLHCDIIKPFTHTTGPQHVNNYLCRPNISTVPQMIDNDDSQDHSFSEFMAMLVVAKIASCVSHDENQATKQIADRLNERVEEQKQEFSILDVRAEHKSEPANTIVLDDELKQLIVLHGSTNLVAKVQAMATKPSKHRSLNGRNGFAVPSILVRP